jgi:zeta-carotene desaturase
MALPKLNSDPNTSVTIVGAGVAGLAAGCALADAGYRVQLLERRPYVGGRASSYEHPGTSEVIDNCQHILLGCCTNLIDLYRRLGVDDQIAWFQRFTYIEPGGRTSVLEPSWLPAPMHTAISFMRAAAFTAADKLAIAWGLSQFLLGIPDDTGEDFAHWCQRHKQTPGAIRRFWEPILVSALNEDLSRMSVHYAGKVIRDSFLSSAQAGRLGIPRIPLSELYMHASEYIAQRGGQVHLRANVDAIQLQPDGCWNIRAGEYSAASDAVLLALPFEAVQKMMPLLPQTPEAEALADRLAAFEHSPITAVHLWFDREITPHEHAVLLDTQFEWMYQVSKLQPSRQSRSGSYLELIVSASRGMVPMHRQPIIDLALRELARFFPDVMTATLVKAAVTKDVRATYSVRPHFDRLRPGAQSPWPGIYLAGDWTATGWPATMEGAVRSGLLAAQSIARDCGTPRTFLVEDLAATGLMRLFGLAGTGWENRTRS